MADILRVGPDSCRADLLRAIEVLRGRQRRLPTHWVDARDALADEIDALVEQVREMDSAERAATVADQ